MRAQVAYDDASSKLYNRMIVHPSILGSCSIHAVCGQGAEEASVATQRLAGFLSGQLCGSVDELVADYMKDSEGRLCLLQVRPYSIT